MSFDRDEALAKIGRRVQLHDFEDDNMHTSFSEDVPAGTTGQVLHANLVRRCFKPVDLLPSRSQGEPSR